MEKLVRNRTLLEDWLGLTPNQLTIPAELAKEMAEVLPVQLEKVRLAPDLYRWYSNWEIINKEGNHAVGGMGLAGQADNEGKVFVGYWIDERYQKKGYMTEALGGLSRWVFEHPEVLFLSASTPLDNLASQKVLVKNGFIRQGEYDGHPFYVLPRPKV